MTADVHFENVENICKVYRHGPLYAWKLPYPGGAGLGQNRNFQNTLAAIVHCLNFNHRPFLRRDFRPERDLADDFGRIAR